MKIRLCSLITALFILANCLTIYANSNGMQNSGLVSSIKRLDLSTGIIQGETCDFTFNIPENWGSYVIAQSEYLPKNSRMMEKIEFFFSPINERSRAIPMFSINVYNKKFWAEDRESKLMFESDNYIFTIYFNDETPNFPLRMDNIVYYFLVEEYSTVESIKNQMTFPEPEKIMENSIVINGNVFPGKVSYNYKNVAFVPLRLVCENLGYDVGWDERSKSIVISRGTFKYNVITADVPGREYTVFLIDDSYYISVAFFMQIMNTSVEIDNKGNVFFIQ